MKIKWIKEIKEKNGISLIILVITIIVLGILAGAVIASLSDSGMLQKFNVYQKSHDNSEAIQEIVFFMTDVQASIKTDITLEDVEKAFIAMPEKYAITSIATGAVLDTDNNIIVPRKVQTLYVTNREVGVEIKIDKSLKVEISEDSANDGENISKDMIISVLPYNIQNVTMGVTANISNLPSQEFINYTSSKFVITDTNEKIGTDPSLYTDGTIISGVTTGSNWSLTKLKTAGTYYLHILFVDNDGNKSEVISQTPITVVGVKEFAYTGNSQSIELLQGNYKIECWGAQGGNNIGGKGAYTSGIIDLKTSKTLYVYVGGTTSSTTGGYNGGGNGAYIGGGGSTDIRLTGGLWNDSSSILSRIMVAAGGSGGYSISGAPGGALTGILPTGITGVAATQSAAGTGGNLSYASASSTYTGAGGGYYSGGTTNEKTETMSWTYIGVEGATVSLDGTYQIAYGESGCFYYKKFTGSVTLSNGVFGDPIQGTVKVGYKTARYHYISSSGSSYISGYTGCATYTDNESTEYSFTDPSMIAGNSSMPDVAGSGTETGHSGNGYCKITYIGD